MAHHLFNENEVFCHGDFDALWFGKHLYNSYDTLSAAGVHRMAVM